VTITALFSGGIAAILSLIELVNARRSPPCIRACHWITIRLAVDSGAAMLAYGVLISVFAGLSWFTGAWPMVVAGLAGPALLRSQLALLGSGQESSTYGPANVYKRAQKLIDDNIGEIGRIAQSEWVNYKAAPAIGGLDFEDTCKIAKLFIEETNKITRPSERKRRIDALDGVMSDGNLSNERKCRYIIQNLVDSGGIRLARALVRQAKRASKGK
jgi:hypothetical protein